MVEVPLLWIRYSRFPILFVGYDRECPDVLATVVQQLQIAKATEFFALLIVVPPRQAGGPAAADALRQAVADSVYRHDFVVLDRELVASIIAQNSSRRLIEIILDQGIELSTLSPYVVRGPVPGNMFFGRESEIKTISQTIQRGDHAVLGGRRIGKSSILLRLNQLFTEDPRYQPMYLDCEARYDYEDFFAGLGERLGADLESDPLAFQRAAATIRQPSTLTVVLLSEMPMNFCRSTRRPRQASSSRPFVRRLRKAHVGSSFLAAGLCIDTFATRNPPSSISASPRSSNAWRRRASRKS